MIIYGAYPLKNNLLLGVDFIVNEDNKLLSITNVTDEEQIEKTIRIINESEFARACFLKMASLYNIKASEFGKLKEETANLFQQQQEIIKSDLSDELKTVLLLLNEQTSDIIFKTSLVTEDKRHMSIACDNVKSKSFKRAFSSPTFNYTYADFNKLKKSDKIDFLNKLTVYEFYNICIFGKKNLYQLNYEEDGIMLAEEEEENIMPFFNNPYANQLLRVSPNMQTSDRIIDGMFICDFEDNYSIRLTNYEAFMQINTAVKKLDLFIRGKFTELNKRKIDIKKVEQINRNVIFHISELITYLKGDNILKQEKHRLKRRIETALAVLKNTDILYYPNGRSNEAVKVYGYGSSYEITEDGYIIFELTEKMAEALIFNSGISQVSTKIFRLQEKNDSLFSLAEKLYIQYTNVTNIVKGRNNKLKVATLLNNCPSIPKPDSLRSSRSIRQKIFNPLSDMLDILSEELGLEYEFCNKGSKPLTEAQIKMLFSAPGKKEVYANRLYYDELANLYVRFSFVNFPLEKAFEYAKTMEKEIAKNKKRREKIEDEAKIRIRKDEIKAEQKKEQQKQDEANKPKRTRKNDI